MVWDQSEKKETLRWVLASGIGLGILVLMAVVSPWIYGSDDAYGFFRQQFQKSGPMLVRAIMAFGILLYADFVTKGDWIDQIGETEYGPTVLFSTLVYAVLCGG